MRQTLMLIAGTPAAGKTTLRRNLERWLRIPSLHIRDVSSLKRADKDDHSFDYAGVTNIAQILERKERGLPFITMDKDVLQDDLGDYGRTEDGKFKVYNLISKSANALLTEGRTVIIDCPYVLHLQKPKLIDILIRNSMLRDVQPKVVILGLYAPGDVIKERMRARNTHTGRDAPKFASVEAWQKFVDDEIIPLMPGNAVEQNTRDWAEYVPYDTEANERDRIVTLTLSYLR